jgi:ABC-type transport system involved in multi-copper enzyme maturation permease subunit
MKILGKINLIAYHTMKEILKSKILINVSFIGVLLVLASYVASEFTYGVPERVALDVGLGMLWFSSVGIAIFVGSSLISKEIESRTVYMIISRPVPRYVFILGKLLGLLFVLMINIALLSLVTIGIAVFLGGKIDNLVLWALLYNSTEVLIVMLIVVLFSLITNTVISVLATIGLLFSGHFIHETQLINFAKNSEVFSSVLKFYHYILPGFYKLNLKDFVLYKQTLPLSYLSINLFYGLTYSCFLIFLILYVFNKKNLD